LDVLLPSVAVEWIAIERFMLALVAVAVVQQGLRTPTELRFENCCTRGIRGLLFGSPFTRRSTKPTALFFAVA
jgi:hypothetical protein